MLSDEEKISLNRMKLFARSSDLSIVSAKDMDIVVTLVEKQSKEIEELREEKAKRQWVHIKENGEVEPLFYVSKDKIKAKIEEIENEDKKYKNYLKDGRENFTPEYIWARPILQSFLEKE